MRSTSIVVSLSLAAAAHAQFAAKVVSYDPGSAAGNGYNNPKTALGRPERFTGEGVFPSAVTPFNSPFGTDEIVTIGGGGHLTVKFNAPIVNDPNNPFGIDLLVFGNAFYFDKAWPTGVVGMVDDEGGLIEVSADGTTWHEVTGVSADGNYPTLGYRDLTDPYALTPGLKNTSFQRPVDPSFDPIDKNFAEILAAYNGSGGGAGVDIGALGLSEISYVRVSHALGLPGAPDIDAFVDVKAVPAPGFGVLTLVGLLALRQRREA